MASYNYYLKDSQSKTISKTETPVYLLFDDGVNRAKIYIQLSINPKHWIDSEKRADKKIKRTLTNWSDFNVKLKKIQDKAIQLHTKLSSDGNFSIDAFRDALKVYIDEIHGKKKSNLSGENKSFTRLSDFIKYHIAETERNKSKKPNTIRKYKSIQNAISEYEKLRGVRFTFDQITISFYNNFLAYLRETKKHTPNTVGKYISTLKGFMNEATVQKFNTNLDYQNSKFKSISEQTDSIYLTETELDKIYKHDFSENKKLERVRDLFIIGCNTGLRFSDFSELRRENIQGDYLKVKTKKTGATVVIPIHAVVKEIFDKYAESENGLPMPCSNQKMNEYLKDVGKEVKLNEMITITKTKGNAQVQEQLAKYKLITTHTARRSFATNNYKKYGNAHLIMQITGHKTEVSFFKYIKQTKEESADKLRELWRQDVKLKVV